MAIETDVQGGKMEIYAVAWLAAGIGILIYFIYTKVRKK